jgi:four helix bundle protein
MESRIISDRSFAFACRIVKLCERLWKGGPASRKIADQLFDCGTSIGANCAEAQGAQTKPDFAAKLSVSRKESWETIFWLRLGIEASIIPKDEVAWSSTKRIS